MAENKKEFCSCGHPQSSPIPHEHDQTDREKVIIKHFEDQQRIIPEVLIEVLGGVAHLEIKSVGVQVTFRDYDNATETEECSEEIWDESDQV